MAGEELFVALSAVKRMSGQDKAPDLPPSQKVLSARAELRDVIKTLSAKDAFKQSATEMVTELKEHLSSAALKDTRPIKAGSNLLTDTILVFMKSAVPEDMAFKAREQAQGWLNNLMEKTLGAPDNLQFNRFARSGLLNYVGDAMYKDGNGQEFLESLDDSKIGKIARLGVLNALDDAIHDAPMEPSASIRYPEAGAIFKAASRLERAAYDSIDHFTKRYELDSLPVPKVRLF